MRFERIEGEGWVSGDFAGPAGYAPLVVGSTEWHFDRIHPERVTYINIAPSTPNDVFASQLISLLLGPHWQHRLPCSENDSGPVDVELDAEALPQIWRVAQLLDDMANFDDLVDPNRARNLHGSPVYRIAEREAEQECDVARAVLIVEFAHAWRRVVNMSDSLRAALQNQRPTTFDVDASTAWDVIHGYLREVARKAVARPLPSAVFEDLISEALWLGDDMDTAVGALKSAFGVAPWQYLPKAGEPTAASSILPTGVLKPAFVDVPSDQHYKCESAIGIVANASIRGEFSCLVDTRSGLYDVTEAEFVFRVRSLAHWWFDEDHGAMRMGFDFEHAGIQQLPIITCKRHARASLTDWKRAQDLGRMALLAEVRGDFEASLYWEEAAEHWHTLGELRSAAMAYHRAAAYDRRQNNITSCLTFELLAATFPSESADPLMEPVALPLMMKRWIHCIPQQRFGMHSPSGTWNEQRENAARRGWTGHPGDIDDTEEHRLESAASKARLEVESVRERAAPQDPEYAYQSWSPE